MLPSMFYYLEAVRKCHKYIIFILEEVLKVGGMVFIPHLLYVPFLG